MQNRNTLNKLSLKFLPLTPERWDDFEKLLGPRGCGGCWCMWWRSNRSEFRQREGEENKKGMRKIVESGEVPGILAYHDGQSVGWCSFGPREAFPGLERSRTLKPVDDQPVWSVVCFFVDRKFRHMGVTGELLKAVITHVKSAGGKIVEGYPTAPKSPQTPTVFAYTGLASTYLKLGFKEVARPSATRPIMRYFI